MGISLKPDYLKRYKDIAWLLIKYGNSDVVKNAGLDEVLGEHNGVAVPGQAKELAADLEKLGPAFVKLGQLLSTRSDLLPVTYLEALSRLQDNCEPFSFKEVETIVCSELGVRLSNAFQKFDQIPLAAASLGQIHHAIMRDGREVAVKVQRPGIREGVVQDLEILCEVADFYDAHSESGRKLRYRLMMDEFRRTVLQELDYRREAHNLETLKANMAEFPLIVVPAPVTSYSTSKVLTMDFIKGRKITAVSPLTLLEVDGPKLAEQSFEAYLKQILVDGFFHADPHPGNVFLTDDHKIALLDLGMVATLTPVMQGKLLQMLLAISECRSDTVANIAIEIGERLDDYDESAVRVRINELIQHNVGASINQMEVGKIVLEITKASAECGMHVPAELTMLGKTLLNLDQVGRTLDPSFDPNAYVRNNAGHIMQQRILHSVSPANAFTALVEAKDFAEKLPGRVSKIMDLLASNKLEVKVDAIDEVVLIDAFQKVANRITIGLVLAALIIGASLLMNVQTDFTLFGYPGLAMVCFLAAAGGGFTLVVHIAFYDQKPKKFVEK
ncbi:MAG: AarF/ABC1/UbiB kinase family protein [Cyanobacteria bacterium SZAS TMP-1]|nr:AarF/ABC1/UbiB kinase family protein [Cyanobacteria bacterium SZAS TMP-1]